MYIYTFGMMLHPSPEEEESPKNWGRKEKSMVQYI
jgi:hypothetical protein